MSAYSCEVLVIGAGAAGLQSAEELSKQSPLRLARPASSGAAAAAEAGLDPVQHSVSVLVLEGRDRIGGRIHTVAKESEGEPVALEYGAVSSSQP